MYHELLEAWRREVESRALCPLPADFYRRLSAYVKKLRGELEAGERSTLQGALSKQELENVGLMARSMAEARVRKLVDACVSRGEVSLANLTPEERQAYSALKEAVEALRAHVEKTLAGEVEAEARGPESRGEAKKIIVRFLQDTPAIVGLDLRVYGPFKREDVGSLPEENANLLIKHGVVRRVEV